MRHLNDDDLVLHYYGEDGPEMVAVERHLRSCAQCMEAYNALTRTLNVVTPPETAPETVGAPDDQSELRQLLRESSRSRSWHAEAGAIVDRKVGIDSRDDSIDSVDGDVSPYFEARFEFRP